MSHHKLPAVKHALKVLRSAAENDHGVLTMREVEALEACANSQAELLKALEVLYECPDPSHFSFGERMRLASAAIARAKAAPGH